MGLKLETCSEEKTSYTLNSYCVIRVVKQFDELQRKMKDVGEWPNLAWVS